jgi:hypothetical protein
MLLLLSAGTKLYQATVGGTSLQTVLSGTDLRQQKHIVSKPNA